MSGIDMLKIIEREKEKWLIANSEEKIAKDVADFLDAAKFRTVLKICGFELSQNYSTNKYTWVVDHCNNRSGNSVVGDVIKKSAADHVAEMLGEFSKMDAAELKQVRDAAHKEYMDSYRGFVRLNAKKLAEQHAAAFITKEIGQALSGEAEKMRLILMDTNK